MLKVRGEQGSPLDVFLVLALPVLLFVFLPYSCSVITVYHIIAEIKIRHATITDVSQPYPACNSFTAIRVTAVLPEVIFSFGFLSSLSLPQTTVFIIVEFQLRLSRIKGCRSDHSLVY